MICFAFVAGLQAIVAGYAAWRCGRDRFWVGLAAALMLACAAVGSPLMSISSAFWLPGAASLLAAIPATVLAFRRADGARDASQAESAAYALLGAVVLQSGTLVVLGFGHTLLAMDAP